MYIGSWAIDNTVVFTVTTHDPATGALVDADSAPSWRCYENETGTAILSGTMALLDDANTTGHYSEQITLSAANGFEKGKSYNIYIAAVVGGVTGGTTRCLQVEAEVDANTVSNIGANVITAASIATGAIDADALATDAVTEINAGGGGLDAAGVRAAIGLANANLDTQLAAIDDLLDTEVGTINTNVSTLVTRLGTPSDLGSGATIADNLTDIDAAAGGGLDAAGVRAAVGLAAANLDTQLGAIDDLIDTEVAAIKTVVDAVKLKTDNLPGDPADASVIADAFTGVNTKLDTIDDFLDTEVAAIKAKTDNLPADPADASDIAASFATVNTAIADLPTNAELATALAAADDAVLAAIAALNNLSAAQVNAEVVDALTVDVIADSTPALGSRPTIAEAVLMLTRLELEKAVSGTTVTVNKEDGATAALTATLDDASDPTSISRAS